jgi:hypothetical protein
VITSQREQYMGTVHLFIGTKRSPDKNYVCILDSYNHDTNYQGLSGFSSLSRCCPSSQACHLAEALSTVASAYSFMLCLLAYHLVEGVFA